MSNPYVPMVEDAATGVANFPPDFPNQFFAPASDPLWRQQAAGDRRCSFLEAVESIGGRPPQQLRGSAEAANTLVDLLKQVSFQPSQTTKLFSQAILHARMERSSPFLTTIGEADFNPKQLVLPDQFRRQESYQQMMERLPTMSPETLRGEMARQSAVVLDLTVGPAIHQPAGILAAAAYLQAVYGRREGDAARSKAVGGYVPEWKARQVADDLGKVVVGMYPGGRHLPDGAVDRFRLLKDQVLADPESSQAIRHAMSGLFGPVEGLKPVSDRSDHVLNLALVQGRIRSDTCNDPRLDWFWANDPEHGMLTDKAKAQVFRMRWSPEAVERRGLLLQPTRPDQEQVAAANRNVVRQQLIQLDPADRARIVVAWSLAPSVSTRLLAGETARTITPGVQAVVQANLIDSPNPTIARTLARHSQHGSYLEVLIGLIERHPNYPLDQDLATDLLDLKPSQVPEPTRGAMARSLGMHLASMQPRDLLAEAEPDDQSRRHESARRSQKFFRSFANKWAENPAGQPWLNQSLEQMSSFIDLVRPTDLGEQQHHIEAVLGIPSLYAPSNTRLRQAWHGLRMRLPVLQGGPWERGMLIDAIDQMEASASRRVPRCISDGAIGSQMAMLPGSLGPEDPVLADRVRRYGRTLPMTEVFDDARFQLAFVTASSGGADPWERDLLSWTHARGQPPIARILSEAHEGFAMGIHQHAGRQLLAESAAGLLQHQDPAVQRQALGLVLGVGPHPCASAMDHGREGAL